MYMGKQIMVKLNLPPKGIQRCSRTILFDLEKFLQQRRSWRLGIVKSLHLMSMFIPSPVREGSIVFGDHKGSIILNKAEASHVG